MPNNWRCFRRGVIITPILSLLVVSFLGAKEEGWATQIHKRLNFIDLDIFSLTPSSNTLIFTKEKQEFFFRNVIGNSLLQPEQQRIANFINQVYYSTKFNFSFNKYFYVQSGKILRKIHIERSAKRSQNARVRMIFIGFEW